MGVARRSQWRVLAIDPTPGGLAYAVLEGPNRLIDWGVATGSSARAFRKRVGKLALSYNPNIMALEREFSSRRRPRARSRILMAAEVAASLQIATCKVSRSDIRTMFEADTKLEIARGIAVRFPELLHKVPTKRGLGMPEAQRMSVFDAVSFALVVLGKV